MRQKIYRVHYSYLAGSPTDLMRVEHHTHWFLSKERMKECYFWRLKDSPRRQFEYTIEESVIELSYY